MDEKKMYTEVSAETRLSDGLENGLENGLKDGETEAEFTPPDGGWGWVVCLSSFWTNGTVFGILNTFGILYVEILKEFDTGQADLAFKTSWIGALQISMTFFLSPVASILVDRLGIRVTGLIGAICATLGMFLSAFVRRMEYLYLTYGLLLGIGSSLVYSPSLVILGHYFKKHLGIVNGIASFGSSFFTILISFLEQILLSKIGLYKTMMVLSALLAVLIPGSLTWIPLYKNKREVSLKEFASNQSLYQPWRCGKGIRNVFNFDIWKNKGYRIWAIALPTAFLGYFIPFVHLVKHTSVVMPGVNGGVLVMCLSVTSGVSRLIFGKVADLPNVNRVVMQQFSFIVLGMATACIPFCRSFWLLILLALVMGIADGAFICLLGPIAFDLLGPSGAPQGLGFLLGTASLTMTAGPPLAGLVFDYLGSYNIAFWAAGIPPVIGALLLFLVPRKRK